jgi:predicted GTPase
MKKVIILGAAGRDFHNFNMYFRNNKEYKVLAFVAMQIPFIADRVYPSDLAGKFYPSGIPIYDERKLIELIKDYSIDEVILAYSDLSYKDVMHLASIAITNGSSFRLLGLKDTQLIASKPVIAITATRTGAGKSTFARSIARIAKQYYNIAIIRHPMPYLTFDPIQSFNDISDLNKYNLTIEEEEEYIDHLIDHNPIYAGVDYELILKEVESKHDLIIWDGGNNDFPFIKPNLHITIFDPLRAEDAINYYPSEVNLSLADVIVINKVNSIDNTLLSRSLEIIKSLNTKALIFKVGSYPILNANINGKKVIIIDDAPSITHGNVKDSITYRLAIEKGAKVIDPKPYAKGSIKDTIEKYGINNIIPSAGYSTQQLDDLAYTISSIDADLIIANTPADIGKRLKIDKPIVRLKFELRGYDYNNFIDYIENYFKELNRS